MQVSAIHRIHNHLMLQKSSDHQLIWKLSPWVQGFVSSPRSCSVWKNLSTIGRFTFLCSYWSSQLKEKGSTNKASYLKTSENPEKKGDPSRSKTRPESTEWTISVNLPHSPPPNRSVQSVSQTAREANRDWQYHQCLRPERSDGQNAEIVLASVASQRDFLIAQNDPTLFLPPGNDHTYPTKREKENHRLKSAFLRGIC